MREERGGNCHSNYDAAPNKKPRCSRSQLSPVIVVVMRRHWVAGTRALLAGTERPCRCLASDRVTIQKSRVRTRATMIVALACMASITALCFLSSPPMASSFEAPMTTADAAAPMSAARGDAAVRRRRHRNQRQPVPSRCTGSNAEL